MTWLKTWRFWASCSVSLLCLWLAFRKTPLGELTHAVAGAYPLFLMFAVVAQLLAIIARAWRWVVLLNGEARLADSFWAQGVGFLFTNIFPLRLGEPARVLLMSEQCQLPVVQVTASAIGERLLDVASNVFILLLVLPWVQAPGIIKQVAVSFSVVGLVGIGILLLIVRFEFHAERIVPAFCSYLPLLSSENLLERWRELVRGFLPLTPGWTAARAVCWSLVTWSCSVAVYWNVLLAFQPEGRLVEAAFMMVALSFAVAVPSSPGFIGVFQFVGQQALILPFGAKYDAASALAITLTAHVIYYVSTTALGVIGLWCLGGSFLTLSRALTFGQLTRKP